MSSLQQPLLSEYEDDGLASVPLEGSHILHGRAGAGLPVAKAVASPGLLQQHELAPVSPSSLVQPPPPPDEEDDMDMAVVADERSCPPTGSSGSAASSAARVPVAAVRYRDVHAGFSAKAPWAPSKASVHAGTGSQEQADESEGSIFSDGSDDELFERMEPVYRKISMMVESIEGSVAMSDSEDGSAFPSMAVGADLPADRIGAEPMPLSPPHTAPRALGLTARFNSTSSQDGPDQDESESNVRPPRTASSAREVLQGQSPTRVDAMSAAITAVRSGLREVFAQVSSSEKISRTLNAISGDKIPALRDGLKEYWAQAPESDGQGSAAAAALADHAYQSNNLDRPSCASSTSQQLEVVLEALPEEEPLPKDVFEATSFTSEAETGLPSTLARAKESAKESRTADFVSISPHHDPNAWKAFELPDSTLQGLVWKRRAYLSRAAKVTRLIRKEAQNLMSDREDWLSGLGNIQLEKVADIAKALMSAVGEPRQRALSDDVNEKERFDRRFLCLRGGTLLWAKLPDSHDAGLTSAAHQSLSLSPMRRVGSVIHGPGASPTAQRYVTAVEPLYGSSSEYVGLVRGFHVIRVFVPHQVMRETLTFAMDTEEEAKKWVAAVLDASKFPLPKPLPHRPCCQCFGQFAKSHTTRCGDCLNARGPPTGGEPPCATLELEIISASGLGIPDGVLRHRPAAFSPYVLGKLGSHEFRTATRYHAGSHATFEGNFTLPVEEEGADELMHLSVFHEPEFEDHEPLLLGAITIPLFTFERNKRLQKVVQLTQTSVTRQGYVNASFGQLALAAKLHQPLGYLWLPVEPVQGPGDSTSSSPPPKKKSVDMADFELQISRIDAILQLINGWSANIAYMLQWEQTRFSLSWLTFLQVWMLFAWPWSLSIMSCLVIVWSYQWRGSASHANEAPLLSDGISRGVASPPEGVEIHDRVIWEAERRIVLAGFSAEYLHEFEKQWSDEHGEICVGPQLVISDGTHAARYYWKVVVNDQTDENGWQYASGFGSSNWMRSFDTLGSWVRRRQHFGRVVEYLPNPPDLELAATDVQAMRLDEQERARAMSNVADTSSGAAGAQQNYLPSDLLELMPTENNQLQRWIRLYVSIRDVIDYWLVLLEKHKNLFTWKDKTVTKVVNSFVQLLAALALVMPTRYIFSFLIGFAFYVGYLSGEWKRKSRDQFIESLAEWYQVDYGRRLSLKPADACSLLEEHGVTRLALRNWCNTTYGIGLDLRTVDSCQGITELADMVIFASDRFEKRPRRYRAWHSDVYGNFFDHVPSDVSEHDPGSACYRTQASSSLPPLLS